MGFYVSGKNNGVYLCSYMCKTLQDILFFNVSFRTMYYILFLGNKKDINIVNSRYWRATWGWAKCPLLFNFLLLHTV